MLTYSGLFRPPGETMGEVLLSAGASPHGLDDPPVIRTRFALYILCKVGPGFSFVGRRLSDPRLWELALGLQFRCTLVFSKVTCQATSLVAMRLASSAAGR